MRSWPQPYNSSWLLVTGGYLLMVHVRVFAGFVHLDVILLSTK